MMPGFFESSYQNNAILQKGFNKHIIEDLVEYILRVCPEAKRKPIKILDCCCGDGGATAYLYLELLKKGILVERLVGSDISPDQIAVAHNKYGRLDPKLVFRCEDALETTESDTFDVVISLFGLHWIPNIQQMTAVIERALKPGGKFMCFIPLEKSNFFARRQSLVASDKWSPYFTTFAFHPFVKNPQDYLEPFKKSFNLENKNGITGTERVDFPVSRFKQFLLSWMQELRHLPEPKRAEYLNDLLNLIPLTQEGHQHDVEYSKDGIIHFYERFLWVHATTQKTPTLERTIWMPSKL